MKNEKLLKAADALNAVALEELTMLMDCHLPTGSKGDKRLRKLARVIERYEKLRYPNLGKSAKR